MRANRRPGIAERFIFLFLSRFFNRGTAPESWAPGLPRDACFPPKAKSVAPGSCPIRALLHFFLSGERFHEFIGFAGCDFFGDAVTLLQTTDQLFASSRDDVQVVVSQFAPFLSYLAFVLFPLAFKLFPVHCPGLPVPGD